MKRSSGREGQNLRPEEEMMRRGEREEKKKERGKKTERGVAMDSLVTVLCRTLQPGCHLLLMTTLRVRVCLCFPLDLCCVYEERCVPVWSCVCFWLWTVSKILL